MLAIKSDTRYRLKQKESNTQRFERESIKIVKESKLSFFLPRVPPRFFLFPPPHSLISLLHNFNIFPQVYFRKIPKISPGAYIFQRPFLGAYIRRGLSTEGNLRFKIDCPSLIVGRKFNVFALFCFVFEGNFQVQAPPPRRRLIFGGVFCVNEGFFALRVWGAYIWRGSFSEFYGIFPPQCYYSLLLILIVFPPPPPPPL